MSKKKSEALLHSPAMAEPSIGWRLNGMNVTNVFFTKKTKQGREVALKFLKESQQLQQDDVLYIDDDIIIAVEILACEPIVLKP